MNQLGIILLAAGGSSRMGFPKQLIPFEGKRLIQVVVERLLTCHSIGLTVVLGANSDEIEPFLGNYPLETVRNSDWQSGMASSIHCGVAYVAKTQPAATHLMLALTDQVFVEAKDYQTLVNAAKLSPNQVIAAFYGGQYGAPMIFPRSFWNDLLQLSGDRGAAAMVRKMQPSDVVSIEMPDALLDWDSPADLPQNFLL